MKKIIFSVILFIFFAASALNAITLEFGQGEKFQGTFKPYVFNVSVLSYYDNGTIGRKCNCCVLDLLVKVKSQYFVPYNANIYVKVNDTITKILPFYKMNANVSPGYRDTYIFAGKILPYEINSSFGCNEDGYRGMLDSIDNITFYFNYYYNDETYSYSYTFDNFSNNYKDFLTEYNNAITSIDTSNYPYVSWNIDDNSSIDALGVCLLEGNDEYWDNESVDAMHKYEYDSKTLFGNWYWGDNILNSLDFSQVSGIMLPGDENLILKVKSEVLANKDDSKEGSSVMRFQACFKKIPSEKVRPITNLTGWKLLGTDEEFYSLEFGKIFDLQKVKTIWTWRNNEWLIWSPDPEIKNMISSYGIKDINLILPNRGFWVNFK